MTRRKKPPPQRKRQQITDASGWTHVINGPTSIISSRTTGLPLEHGKPTGTKYTLETYLDRFRKHYTPVWRASNCFDGLSRIIEQDIIPAENVLVTQCICLGLGSLTAGAETPSFELAALVSVLEMLGKTHNIQDIIFQDPIFAPLDKNILNALGYTVVETPDAFSKVNDTTFLFAPHLECFLYADALETATPALSIGSDLQSYVDGLLSSLAENTKKGSSQIFRNFMRRTDSRPMPTFDRTPWCESLRISWLKSKEDDLGESTIEQGVRSIELAER